MTIGFLLGMTGENCSGTVRCRGLSGTARYNIKLTDDAEKIATRKAFGEALVKLAGKYKNLVVLDADLSSSVQTGKFAKEYPDRHFNMGIAEQNMIGAACGFAVRGKIPFACSFAMFSTGRPWEIIRNSVCYPNLNVKILGSHAGILTGEDGASHQALEDIAIMRVLPNMKVVCPCDAAETFSAVEAACEAYGPVYIRVGRQATSVVYSGVDGGFFGGDFGDRSKSDEREVAERGRNGKNLEKSGKDGGSGANLVDFRFGKSDVLFGADLKKADACIFATGALVGSSLYAASRLAEDGKKMMVVNVSSIKPLDTATVLDCAKRSKVCFTAEDHGIIGGLGGAVAEVFAENGVGVRLIRIGMEDKFGESGKPEDLYRKYGLDGEGVEERVKEVV